MTGHFLTCPPICPVISESGCPPISDALSAYVQSQTRQIPGQSQQLSAYLSAYLGGPMVSPTPPSGTLKGPKVSTLSGHVSGNGGEIEKYEMGASPQAPIARCGLREVVRVRGNSGKSADSL